MFSVDDMKSCIQEWFSDTNDIKDVCDTYITIMTETEKQYEYMLKERIKDKLDRTSK